MHDILIYETKVAVVMAVFYLFFRVLLSRETLHRLNRAVLVCTVIVSFLIPFCVVTVHRTVEYTPTVVEEKMVESGFIENPEVMDESSSSKQAFDWMSLLAALYVSGAVIYLLKITLDVVRLRRMISSSEHHEDISGNTIIVLDEDISPFSWMSYIFLSREDYNNQSNHIMEHERAHIRLGHAKELLLVEILSSMQWFNPAMWYLKSDLKAIYEYEADDAVLRVSPDIKDYQYSLIRKAVSASGYSITNSFNHTILKNRITMMSKTKSKGMAGLRVLYALPLLGVALTLNARQVLDYQMVKTEEQALMSVSSEETMIEASEPVVESVSSTEAESVTTSSESVSVAVEPKAVQIQVEPSSAKEPMASLEKEVYPFQMVEDKPTFNGGDANMFSSWVTSNLKYPEDAKAAGIQGRVTLQFIVTDTGKVSDVKVLRGVDPSLDAEAVRVVSSSPSWAPGKVKGENVNVSYVFPVIFQMAKQKQESGTIDEVYVMSYGDKKPAVETYTTSEEPVDFSALTKKPGFNGAEANEFSKWVNSHLEYPASARTAGVQGMVAVKFKVNSDGKVSDVSVLRGICTALDDEAVRVISSSPAWTPGEVDSKPVAVTYTFPVNFSIR